MSVSSFLLMSSLLPSQSPSPLFLSFLVLGFIIAALLQYYYRWVKHFRMYLRGREVNENKCMGSTNLQVANGSERWCLNARFERILNWSGQHYDTSKNGNNKKWRKIFDDIYFTRRSAHTHTCPGPFLMTRVSFLHEWIMDMLLQQQKQEMKHRTIRNYTRIYDPDSGLCVCVWVLLTYSNHTKSMQ